MSERDRWLVAEDAALLAQCEVDTYRASGPGGQKRNKTSSAVRLRHGPSGLIVIAEESRSQHENKAKALRRLRLAMAVEQRETLPADWRVPDWLGPYSSGGRLAMATSNPLYPRLVALMLDVLEASRGRLADAAALLGITTSQFAKALTGERALQAAANEIRKRWGTTERGSAED